MSHTELHPEDVERASSAWGVRGGKGHEGEDGLPRSCSILELQLNCGYEVSRRTSAGKVIHPLGSDGVLVLQ